MSVQPPAQNAERYCDPEDVANFFDKYDNFDSTTNPTRTEVNNRILAASNRIDSKTGHAWRPRQVKNELKDLDGPYYWGSGTPIPLLHRDIRTPLDPEKGDKLEIWTGSEYRNWVESGQYNEGRGEDFWIDEATGQLHIYRRRWFWRRYKEIRITYRYGKDRVPHQIRDMCAKLTAADLLRTQQYRMTSPGNEEAPDGQAVAESWIEEVDRDLEPYKEVRSAGIR